MSLPKTVWSFSVDDFTKRLDAELEARLAPWTDDNRSLRLRFLIRLGWMFLCSATPEKIAALIADAQLINSINSHEIPLPGQVADKGGPDDAGKRPSLPIDGFIGGSHREFDTLLATAAGVH